MTATISPTAHLSFGGVLASEWIKLRTLRSTVWCYAILITLMIGIGLLIAGFAGSDFQGDVDAQRRFVVQIATFGTVFAQLVVAVLGTLIITGEYGTGMIRSTLAAIPRRTPALIGKIVVFAVVTFVLSLVTMLITGSLAILIVGSRVGFVLFDPQVLLPILGAAGGLALVGVMSLALGTIIRNSAGGLAASLGLLLVLPIVISLAGSLLRAQWLFNVSPFLPNQAANAMQAYVEKGSTFGLQDGTLTLAPWQAGLVLAGWFVLFLVFAIALLKRRDA